MPVPYGLIRFGVAPDHQSLKAVSKRYDKVAESAGVDFIGNVTVGQDVSVAELLDLYDAVILAIGAPHDRKLGIPGEDLPGVVGSAEFVGWYNGHPDFADLDPPLDGSHAAIIGNGNVALDCARILSKTRARVRRVGHRRPCARGARQDRDPDRHHPRPPRPAPDRDDAQGTGRARPSRGGVAGGRCRRLPAARRRPGARARPAQVGHASCANSPTLAEPAKPKTIVFDFFAKPLAIEGDGRAERVIVERTRLDGDKAVGTGETYEVPASLVISCIGYSTPPIEGVPYDERGGKFLNEGGRDRRAALLRRLGAARAVGHDRHQPARRL